MKMTVLATLSVATMTLLAACSSSSNAPPPPPPAPVAAPAAPQPTTVVNSQEASVLVQSVDMNSRLVVLQDKQGKVFTVKAGPEVRNLAQVKSGDRIVVRYTEALVAQMAKPGTKAKTESTVTRAATGSKPGFMAGDEVVTTVTFIQFDPQSNVVTFTPPDGFVRALTVKDLNMRAFLGKLKRGDKVDVTYTEALAISVEPSI